MSRFLEKERLPDLGTDISMSLEADLLFISWNLMMMMNCFCGMVNQRKKLSLKSGSQRFSLSQISDTVQARFKPVQSLSSGFVE